MFLFVFYNAEAASLRLDITRGNTQSTGVAFAPMNTSSNLEHNIAANCTAVILRNLASTGNFNVQMVNTDLSIDAAGVPGSDAWRQFNLDILLTGSVQALASGRMKVHLFIWDIASGKELDGKSFNFDMGNWQSAAHTISDHVFSRLTGEKGLFNSKIVYLAEWARDQKIAVVGHGGANKDYMDVEKAGSSIRAVQFTPDAKHVAYIQNTPSARGKVMLQALDEDSSAMLMEFEGNGSALSFTPDGKTLLLACAQDGRVDIYSCNIDSQEITRLTDNSHNNTSASFSQDGKNVIFASDKSGAMHLYTMHSDGTGVKKISSGSGGYRSPTWSPRGDLIAFAKVRGKSSYIGVMRPDGSREKIVAAGDVLDNPTWSPNGRMLMFTRRTKSDQKNDMTELVTVDLAGTQRNTMEVQGVVRGIHWSSLLGE
ncbi:PD40 domain-containing protein [Anaplasma platys]|uniref:PD40 domain-containing protein n=1 Tax=Anaplasma platys TaxID=949 RepID=UPI00145EF3D6|nr:PD40 domain-containing protein [Anaplasma platys]